MKLIITGLALILSLSASAAPSLIKNKVFLENSHFEKVGKVDSFQWAPDRYENSFKYDIFYYIPKSIENTANVGGLIFTHGGGGSTMDRRGSIAAVDLYMPDLVRIADQLGIIVVAPSANGLNWGGHTRGLMRDLARLMRKELNIDVNRLGVSGHSMGGMGITRNFFWGADEFAFFLPMSAGMEAKHQIEQNLNKSFNVPYVHLQGRNDHFRVFIERCEQQLKQIKNLEAQYGLPSKFELIYHNGDHNYDFNLFKTQLNKLLTNNPRNIYQKELWGSLSTIKTKLVENNITFDYDSEERYFWVEATNTDLSTPERIEFKAKIVENSIEIEMPVMPLNTKGLRLYLHSSLVDLNQPIDVVLNGKIMTTRPPKAGELRNMDVNDPAFNFEDTIDIAL